MTREAHIFKKQQSVKTLGREIESCRGIYGVSFKVILEGLDDLFNPLPSPGETVATLPGTRNGNICASYDMTVRVWNAGSSNFAVLGISGIGGLPGAQGRMMGVMDRQMKLCAGVDWCLSGGEGWAAGVGWDEAVWVWDVGSIMGGR